MSQKIVNIIPESQKKEWCIEFLRGVRDMITGNTQYQFYTEELLANIACNIVAKNKELSELNECPSFAFDLNYNPETQSIHFSARGIVDENETEIPLDQWVTRETLEEIHNALR